MLHHPHFLMHYLLAIALASLCCIWFQCRQKILPYPPGPPAEPIIGHLRVMPKSNQEEVYRAWSKIYGDIMYLRVPGRSFLVLNSLKIATDLLDKRSAIYSDRMRLVLYEMMGHVPNLTFLPYGKQFQRHRRLLQACLNEKQCFLYRNLQVQYTHRLLFRLLNNPQDFREHLDMFSASLIVKIVYGWDVKSDDDPYVTNAREALRSVTSCGPLGSTAVDFFPFLRYFPSWFPGTYYAFKARSFYNAVRRMQEVPFEAIQRQLRNGTAHASFLSHHLDRLQGEDIDDQHIIDLQGAAGNLYGAATDTTTSALLFFVFAMVLFPECQKKAQKEIDGLVGKSRLPEVGDRGSLPYVEALMQEVLRWNTVAPSGIPHQTYADDVYNDMIIPKGTTVIYNAFAILRDESVYSDPDEFNPSRYLPKPEGNGEPHPIGHFGFGRRICPGRHLADVSLWMVMSCILATLDIKRALDDKGKEIVPPIELVTGLTSHPKAFPCVIQPRDEISEKMIRQAQMWDDNET